MVGVVVPSLPVSRSSVTSRRRGSGHGIITTMNRAVVELVVEGLQGRHVFAHAHSAGVGHHGVRVVLSDGREALWDVDGAAGLEAQVMRDGVLVGYVPKIIGSEAFSLEETVEAIATAKYT